MEVLIANIERELDALERDRAKGFKVDEEHFARAHARSSRRPRRSSPISTPATPPSAARRRPRGPRKKMARSRRETTKSATPPARTSPRRAALNAPRESQGEVPLVHADVDTDVVARVVGDWTGIPVGKMQQDDVKAAAPRDGGPPPRARQGPGPRHADRRRGAPHRAAPASSNPKQPVGVLLFVGPSGVGKTETALALADLLYGGERFMTPST
jgi:type VI secretion system protein VasG